MGRFASTVEFYTLYREPYSPEFFRAVAERLGLNGHEALLDIGCGPAPLAVGLAPFVASCTGLDPEPGMIEAAKAAAEQAGVQLTLCLGRVEDFAAGELFDVVTIGRALHWLDRRSALNVLERIVSRQGHILVCHAASIETPATPWLKPYQEICRIWSEDPERQVYRLETKGLVRGLAVQRIRSHFGHTNPACGRRRPGRPCALKIQYLARVPGRTPGGVRSCNSNYARTLLARWGVAGRDRCKRGGRKIDSGYRELPFGNAPRSVSYARARLV